MCKYDSAANESWDQSNESNTEKRLKKKKRIDCKQEDEMQKKKMNAKRFTTICV